jgi:Tfp pilus assembly protein PilX
MTTTSRLEAEISGNDKTYKEAFYAAEMSLTVGETVVTSLTNRVDLDEGTKPGRYVKGTQPAWSQLVWDNAHSAVPCWSPLPNRWSPLPDTSSCTSVTAIPSGLSNVSAPPRYTIEERDFRRDSLTVGIGATTGTYMFTVRGDGTGSSKAAHVFLETIYVKRYN